MEYEKCPSCEKVTRYNSSEKFADCNECGVRLIVSEQGLNLTEDHYDKLWQEAKETGDFSNVGSSTINKWASYIILTTAPTLAGKSIDSELEIISAECVYGMHIFKDFFAGVRDIFGGRSKVIQDTLRDARKTAMAELRRECLIVGGDAVIGVKLDYHEITGGGKNGMIMLVASGTAVKIK